MRAIRVVLALLFVFSNVSFAVLLRENLEFSSSVSNTYDARSVFTNPAALGFQTELNGIGLLSSFTYTGDRHQKDEHSLGFAFGYLGFGSERLSEDLGSFSRYTFASGIPVSHSLYLGTRYSFTRSDIETLNRFNSLDLGLQYRLAPYLSLGVLANTMNQPEVDSTRLPTEFVFGVTLRPIQKLELAVDVNTLSDSFGKTWGYQTNASVEILQGLRLRAGYHQEHKFQAGLQFNFNLASLYSITQPGSPEKPFMAGVQLAVRPYPSFLSPKTAVKAEVDGSLSEEPSHSGLFAKEHLSLLELLRTLEKAESDPHVKVVLIKLETFPLGLAAAQDLFQTLWKVKKAGKKVEVFLGNAGIKEYLIASAATKIHMESGGELRLMGLRSERYYLKGTLDKIGVEGMFLAKGDYKSAPEMFTRKESSEKSREETLSELKQAEKEIVGLLQQSRNIGEDRWHQILKQALYGANEAREAGLIDSVDAYSTELEKLKRNCYWVREDLRMQSDRLSLASRVAVITASGDILDRKIPLLSLGGYSQVTPQKMESRFKRALADPLTRAIVLRVNSPGGEILASHEIASLVEFAKTKKPVVVSMGDVAASGGYMISVPADRVFAQPLTVTGSIGVFLGKFNLGKLYEKIDLRKEILTHAPFAGLFSEDRPWTKEEREILVRRLDHYYDDFVSFVSLGRKMAKQETEKIAQGRVWLGAEALRYKLIDEAGGYLDAIHYAAGRVGLSADDYEPWPIREESGLFNFFGDDGWFSQTQNTSLGELTSTLISRDLIRELYWISKTKEQPFLYLAPVGEMR